MSHEEITTKIELPSNEPTVNNIVRVDFANSHVEKRATEEKRAEAKTKKAPPIIEKGRRSSLFPSIKDIDLTSPWVFRLVAVILVLVLSLLVL